MAGAVHSVTDEVPNETKLTYASRQHRKRGMTMVKGKIQIS